MPSTPLRAAPNPKEKAYESAVAAFDINACEALLE
jgi:hypothetical protein